jgi:hypothetical protein
VQKHGGRRGAEDITEEDRDGMIAMSSLYDPDSGVLKGTWGVDIVAARVVTSASCASHGNGAQQEWKAETKELVVNVAATRTDVVQSGAAYERLLS